MFNSPMLKNNKKPEQINIQVLIFIKVGFDK